LGIHDVLADQETIDRDSYLSNSKTNPNMHAVVNGGMTYGGDTLVKVMFSDGETRYVKAGSFWQVGYGVLWQSDYNPVAIQVTLNYHFDLERGSDGSALFFRYPIEALFYYTGKEGYRIGGGLRYVNAPMRTINEKGTMKRISFDDAVGFVGEIGYKLSPNWWVNARGVYEKYTAKDYTVNRIYVNSFTGQPPVNGSHAGVNFTYQF
jgi:hypothetical protein